MINTELPFDATVIGFEVYATVPGKLVLNTVNFDLCGISIKCGDYFRMNRKYISRRLGKNLEFNLNLGYNRIIFTNKLSLVKGTLFLIKSSSNAEIALDTSNEYVYGDFYIDNNDLFYLNDTENTRYFFNVIIDVKYYQKTIILSRIVSFDQNIEHLTLNARFKDSENTTEVEIIATNCK